jgi:hypothetical protein
MICKLICNGQVIAIKNNRVVSLTLSYRIREGEYRRDGLFVSLHFDTSNIKEYKSSNKSNTKCIFIEKLVHTYMTDFLNHYGPLTLYASWGVTYCG